MTKRVSPEESKDVMQNKVPLATTGYPSYNTGKWTDDEHERFLKAIKIHGNLWKKVKECVGTRSCAQIRSHCQKYFRRKRNMKLQELRRTNRLKGMIFLVIEEYYNYAASSNKHGEAQSIYEPKSVKVEEREIKSSGRVEGDKQLDLSLVNNSELIGICDLPEDEPNDLSFGIEKMGILANEEGLSNEVNRYESDFQLNGGGLYEQDNDLSLNNPFY